jgi:thiamine kinase-like enzyme
MALEDVLASVPELRDGEVEPLAGGLTNTNYKVTSPAGVYVVRLAGKDTELLAIDRENEIHNTIAAAETGVGAPVVAALPEHGALVLEFLDGEVMDAEKLRRGDRLAAIASACRRLHAGRRFLHTFDMFQVQRRYLALVQERGFRLPDRYLELEPKIRQLEGVMRVRSETTVPCNNDLLAENFIDVGGAIRLIDYEYSGNNEPSFELGNLWSESNLSLEQLEDLVRHYYGAATRAKIARARLWGLVSKYGWTLWGSIQASVSEMDFDFWAWGMEKYERAVAELDGPDFDRLLDDVKSE